jgi:DNA-binding CsgD family transcriptional regulator
MRAVAAIRRGRLKEGLAFANRAAAMADVVPVIRSFAGAAQAEALLQLGRAAESQARCDEAEEIAASRDEKVALVWLWHVRAQQRSHEGRLDEACGLYRRIEDLNVEMGLGEPCLVPWASHAIDAYIRCDLWDDASRVTEWLQYCSLALPCRWPRIAVARGQAALEAAGAAHDAAEAHFRTALALHEGIELPVEKAETLLAYGAFLRRIGQSARARLLLAEALRLAEAAEAAGLAGEAGEEFRVARGRRRRAHEQLDQLTAQEERIARLAGEGLSNRQIADQVRLSVKTVEFHLQQVYSKLGIRSRRELILMKRAALDALPL